MDEILIFLAIVETGSFISAGRSMGLSRSAAGKALSRLEAHCGARLLNRTSRAMSLTEDGQRLYAQGVNLRSTLDAVGSQFAGDGGTPRGELRISAPDALGRRLVLPVVKRFLAAWPEVQAEMSLSDGVSDLIAEGADLAVRIGVRTPNPSLICRTLRQEPLVLCASPAYLSQTALPTRVEHLSQHDLLFHTSQNMRQSWHLEETDGTWVRASGRSRLRLDSGEALREAALADLGVALLPNSLVKGDLAEGRLQRVLPKCDTGSVEIMALYPHRRMLEAKVRHFVDMLAADLAISAR
ncbi:LysR family transcriptional regulator [Salipiger sp. IMCC34102]|uniref:LysR family transcriptional regulator n=1 Tax=Salipiger sp. IMCC34102 TaxID=2510647 RepID=UPI001A930D0C|nr:LysR family transcriptional regulator [Salipiger sp. IMCC34102]